MRFGPVKLAEAEGAILAHSVALPKGRLRKGVTLDSKHLDALRDAGVEEITVAQLDQGDVSENVAADRLAGALLADGNITSMRRGQAATGRVNIFAAFSGIAEIDVDAIHAVNVVDPMITVATVPFWHRLKEGGMAATVKIISYGVPEAALVAACQKAQGALRLRRPVMQSASLIQTTVGAEDGEKGQSVTAARLARFGVTLTPKALVPHKIESLAKALELATGDVLLILTGSATSDLADVAPEAVRRAGGVVHHFGMPVDPGNLLFLGELNGKPVIGLPGCARSPALNGADWVLERILCGVPVTSADIQGMGVGGLLKEIPTRPQPRKKIDRK